MGRTVIHIGAVKTGTTYLQTALEAKRDELAAAGWLYPGPIHCHVPQFAALLGDDAPWSGPDWESREKNWDPMAAEIASWDGSVLLSAENLAGMTSELITRILDELGRNEVEIVVTARDLARVVASDMQQKYRIGETWSCDEFCEALAADRSDLNKWWWWRSNALHGLVARWKADPRVKSFTIVVNPQKGATETLWARFVAGADLPLDGSKAPQLPAGDANLSLTADQARLLRYLTIDMKDVNGVPADDQADIRARICSRMLARQNQGTTGSPMKVPWRWRQRFDEWTINDIEQLSQQECRVVGDLEELRPIVGDEPSIREPDPTDLSESELPFMKMGIDAIRASAGHPKYLEPNRITLNRLIEEAKGRVGASRVAAQATATRPISAENDFIRPDQEELLSQVSAALRQSDSLAPGDQQEIERRVRLGMHNAAGTNAGPGSPGEHPDLAVEIAQAVIAVYGHTPQPPVPLTMNRIVKGAKRRIKG